MLISIIVPTYRPKIEKLIPLIKSLISQDYPCELIFSDAEKSYFPKILNNITDLFNDSKVELKVVLSVTDYDPLTRGQSINLGIKQAKGDILLILHVDNTLPDNALRYISKAMENENYIAGGFLKRYNPSFFFGITAKMANIRAIFLKRMAGTNAMFMRRDICIKNPFSKHFMEDICYSDFLVKAYSKKRVCIIHKYVSVSSHKYIKAGPLKQIAINVLILYLYRQPNSNFTSLRLFYNSAASKSFYDILLEAYRLYKGFQGV